jgi:hypothetical protein
MSLKKRLCKQKSVSEHTNPLVFNLILLFFSDSFCLFPQQLVGASPHFKAHHVFFNPGYKLQNGYPAMFDKFSPSLYEDE